MTTYWSWGCVGVFMLVFSLGVSLSSCDSFVYVPPAGVIYSPKYPLPYENNTNCMWHILSHETDPFIILNIEELDIEADEPEVCGYDRSHKQQCCKHNWLSVPVSGSGKLKSQQLCGQNVHFKTILVRASEVNVKFHISRVNRGGRGFKLSYKTVSTGECTKPGMVPCGPHADAGCYNNMTQRCDGVIDCLSGLDEAVCPTIPAPSSCQLSCRTGGQCYSLAQKCDGTPDCHDFSDETDCGVGVCEKGQALCSAATHHCFNPQTQRCDGKFDCPWGEDEVGCVPGCEGKIACSSGEGCYTPSQRCDALSSQHCVSVPGCEGKIACSSGEGCYTPSQRCDALSDCLDMSDERACPREFCAWLRDKRQCRNSHCLPAALWCDGADDCGDNSDEEACLKNSVIAITIMGSLFCGLMLVVAVGCFFRVYGHRFLTSPSNYHLHISPHLASRLRMSASASLPTLVDDDFFLREPPPAYSVAVGEREPSIQNVPTRPRRQRRIRAVAVPPPQVVVIKPPELQSTPCETEDASSSQSSPSRGSVTSSSYVSGTDDTLLLSS